MSEVKQIKIVRKAFHVFFSAIDWEIARTQNIYQIKISWLDVALFHLQGIQASRFVASLLIFNLL